MTRSLLYILTGTVLGVVVGCGEATIPPTHETLRPLLNSERIERIFGSYGIEVLETDSIRVSNLYSLENDQRICRTLAIVRFSDSIPPELLEPYQAIKNGSSLGATLKQAGWTIEKRHQYFGEIKMGDRFRELANLENDPKDRLYALHIYTLWAANDDTRHPFSTIAEIHHPKYITLSDLKSIYPTELIDNLEADADDLQIIALAQSASQK